jgi:hypothetical protein
LWGYANIGLKLPTPDEGREYAYNIQAMVDLRPPFYEGHMNDFHQDARSIKTIQYLLLNRSQNIPISIGLI